MDGMNRSAGPLRSHRKKKEKMLPRPLLSDWASVHAGDEKG